jgi:dTDP-4-amino-4,6-dideoxygalactose transaminase
MDYKIPLFDLNFDEKEEQAVLDVIRSKWISTGPKTAQLEQQFAGMLNTGHAVALSNCTVALHLALKLAGIKENDEVICPSLTFVATVNAIRYLNALPVFADVKSYMDFTIDPSDIERKITPRTKAILVMHYAGFPCNMDAIMDLAERFKLKVIEDACHGPLSEYKGKKLGTIGDIACFSFFSNKNISTGEGGMLVTNNHEYAEQAKLLRSHGMTSLSYERAKGHSTDYDVVTLGFNYRMDDIRASIGIVQLDKLHDDLLKRAGIRREYLQKLEGIEGLTVPFSGYTGFVSNYIMPVLLTGAAAGKRDEVRIKMHKEGIQTSVHYPPVHRFSIYRHFGADLPITEYVAANELTLPMYSKLTIDDIGFIASAVKSILAN